MINGIPIKIIRSDRKTLSIEVRAGGVSVRAPRRTRDKDIRAFILEKEDWIKKHYAAAKERADRLEKLTPFTVEELKALANKARSVLPERVSYYADIVGVEYNRITVRAQHTRWGSCSGKGNLNFNCLMMLLPGEVFDSIIVHELCHLKHMDHSPQFYREVEKAFPEYRKCNKWLKQNGSAFLCRIP